MRMRNYFHRIQRIFLFVFTERLIQLLWYFFWIILLVRQWSRPLDLEG